MKRRGFTLIELLAVIVIIGILASVVVFYTGNVRSKTRDTKRKTDLKQLSTAIEQYAVNNGAYPIWSGWTNWDVPRSNANENTWTPSITYACVKNPDLWLKNASEEFPRLIGSYITDIPSDPLYGCKNDNRFNEVKTGDSDNLERVQYTYLTGASQDGLAAHYILLAKLENADIESNGMGDKKTMTPIESVNGKYKALYYINVIRFTASLTNETRALFIARGGDISR